jgi:endonuclease/exonuclease/phosphatase family metal-dependent hydrolase
VLFLAAVVVLACVTAVLGDDEDACDAVVRGADRRKNRSRLKIVTFNLYWLFLEDWMTGIKPDGPWASKAAAEKHASSMAAELDALDADIVVVQETENCFSLQRVRAQMKTGADYKVFFVQGKDSSTGQDVLLLSRVDPQDPVYRTDARASYPVAGSQCGWSTPGDTSISKNLFARFVVSGFPPFLLVGLHLVARPTDPERCAQREAQATLARDAVKAELAKNRDYGVVVLGDMNDWDDALIDADSSKPKSRVLSLLKSATTPPLRSTAEFVAQADRWTHCSTYCNKPDCSLLDHLLVSDNLLQLSVDVGADQKNREKFCVDEKPNGGSDHWPVSISLYACNDGEAGCPCGAAGQCQGGLECSSEGCVHARTCAASWPQLSQCPCLAPKASTKRATRQAPAKLVITGAIDGPLTGSTPKVVELFVLEGGSLETLGLAVAVNGGGAPSAPQATFPSGSTATKGRFIYCATTSSGAETKAFLGIEADYVFPISPFNGDDAILLYEDSGVVDALGDATYVSSASFAFDDGFISRNDCSSPSRTFKLSDWTPRRRVWPSGTTIKTNAGAGADKYPLGAFKATGCSGPAAPTSPLLPGLTTTTGAPPTPRPSAAPGKCIGKLVCSAMGVCECVPGERGCQCTSGGVCETGLECKSTAVHGTRCFLSRGENSTSTMQVHWMWIVTAAAVAVGATVMRR